MEQKKFIYCNCQLSCLHQNVVDFTGDILKMKVHMSIIHEGMKKSKLGSSSEDEIDIMFTTYLFRIIQIEVVIDEIKYHVIPPPPLVLYRDDENDPRKIWTKK